MGKRVMQRMTFEGRRAVVTGAAMGIGRVRALLLADRGAQVLAVDRDPEVGRLADEPGGRIEHAVTDLADRDALERLGERLTTPATDVLVNCAAAYPPRGGFLAAGFADWETVLRVNV